MRIHHRPSWTGVIPLLGIAILAPSAWGQTPGASPLSLDQAIARALANNRSLLAAGHRVAEVRGDLTRASQLLSDNPQLVASRGRLRDGARLDGDDFEVGIEQSLEIGGQRGRRIAAAIAGSEASQADASDFGRELTLLVALRFYQGVAAEERVALADETVTLAASLLELAGRRTDAGIGTPLEYNAAAVRLAEARRRALSASADREALGLELSRLMGEEPVDVPALAGALPVEGHAVDRDAVVRRALLARPDLMAAVHRRDAAVAEAGLARAESWPDVSVSVSLRREQGQDLLNTGIRVPLAFFDRNQGTRATTSAARDRTEAELEARALAVTEEAAASVILYERARAAVELYSAEVLAAQRESLELVELAADAGELDLSEVLVVQRELIEGLNGYLEARLDLAVAQSRLLAALALPQTYDLAGGIS